MKLNTKKLSLTAILLAFALIIGTIEHSLPPLIPYLPFVRVGLSNVVVLFSAIVVGVFPAVIICILKSTLVPLFIGNPMMIAYSLSASFISLICAILLIKTKKIAIPTIAIFSSIVHNVVQLCVASIIMENTYSFAFLPYLAVIATISGLTTGIITYLLIKFLPNKIINAC